VPAIVAWIVWGIGSALVSWVVRIVLGFGLAVVTTTVALPPLRAFLVAHVSGLPSTTVQLLGYMGVDKGLTMILSAMAIAFSGRVALRARANSAS
jgi:hypothetical protein